MINDNLIQKLKNIPHKPGCYLWKDDQNQIIYVGKAKNLFKRTHSYFSGNKDNKTMILVQQIKDVDYVVVDNVNDALILENNLIKLHKPKFNILLKDGGNYPYILLTNHEHPMLVYSHHYEASKGTFYGPLADNKNKKELLDLLNALFKFRKCKTIPNEKCIYYDIGQCLAPCINKILPSTYQELKKEVDSIFKGNTKSLISDLKQQEIKAAMDLNFETANKLKKLQDSLENIFNAGMVQLNNDSSFDVIAFYENDGYLSINIFNYLNGKLLNKHSSILENFVLDINESITNYIYQYYEINKLPNKIIVNLDEENINNLNTSIQNKFKNAKSNEEKNILNLAIENAKEFYNANIHIKKQKQNKITNAINELKEITKLTSLDHIESFDNSNINLEHPVAAMVCYINHEFSRINSRKYNLDYKQEIKSDYHFMQEVIFKRYSKLQNNNQKLPNLIIVDGGLIQLRAAKISLEKLNLKIPLIGLKKDSKHKTNSIVLENETEILIDKKSDLYNFLAKIQDDTHNFAIEFFRKKHTKNSISSILETVEGIGRARIKKLLSIYNSIDEIKKASDTELMQILPKDVLLNLRKKIK